MFAPDFERHQGTADSAIPRPVIMGEATERFVLCASAETRHPRGMSAAAGISTGKCFVPAEVGATEGFRALPDGNRAILLPEVTVAFAGRAWCLGVKGVGALSPAYGDEPAELGSAPTGRIGSRELWLGDAPFGFQGDEGAATGLEITELGLAGELHGFEICPVIAVERIPDPAPSDAYWYRRYAGSAWQEHRLLPSNVRLFYGSEHSLGRSVMEVLEAYAVRSTGELESFIERYVRTGIAALTVWARTARARAGSARGAWTGLDYDDVWLDKDSVLASDGSLCFVDLEGLVWRPSVDEAHAQAVVRRQFERNVYEWMYGLDCLLRAQDVFSLRTARPGDRRRRAAAFLQVALEGDGHVQVALRRDAAVLLVSSSALRCPVEIVAIELE